MSRYVGYQILRYSDGLSECWRRRYTGIDFEFLVKLQINCNESKYLFKSTFGKEEMDSAEGSGRLIWNLIFEHVPLCWIPDFKVQ